MEWIKKLQSGDEVLVLDCDDRINTHSATVIRHYPRGKILIEIHAHEKESDRQTFHTNSGRNILPFSDVPALGNLCLLSVVPNQ